jgi:polyisoprenoid-binding protein YceI
MARRRCRAAIDSSSERTATMKALVIGLSALFVTVGVLAASSRPPSAADTFQVDPIHSSMIFRVKHMGVANFYGRFNSISGSFTLDDDANKNSFQVEIQTASVDTVQKKRDDHLKSPDFFNAAQFPKITFKSTQVAKSGDSAFDVTGDLSLHGVTKSVTAKVTKTGTANMRGRQVAGVEAVLTIKRSDFGMTYGLEGISDEVYIALSLEGGKQ